MAEVLGNCPYCGTVFFASHAQRCHRPGTMDDGKFFVVCIGCGARGPLAPTTTAAISLASNTVYSHAISEIALLQSVEQQLGEDTDDLKERSMHRFAAHMLTAALALLKKS